MMHRLLVDVINRPEYVVRYEQVDDITFTHAVVHQWSPRIARQFRDDIDAAQKLLGQPVYVLRTPEVSNQPKFLAMHGFRPCGHVRDAQGRVVEIYERSLDGQPVRRWHAEDQPDRQ
jgi:hypothetical protein